MLTITIFAAGLVCLAGVLGLRLGRAQAQVSALTAGTARAVAEPTTDERGITLQTLIVTAVLVLMAVAAGVVIVAITNNAADDLEQANPNLESNCTQTEIFDPLLAARNDPGRAGGTSAGVDGSDDGCLPVCVFTGSTTNPKTIDSSEIRFVRNYETALSGTAISETAKLVFRNPRTLVGWDSTNMVTTDISITANSFTSTGTGNLAGGVEVRLIPARDACGVYDEDGELVWPT